MVVRLAGAGDIGGVRMRVKAGSVPPHTHTHTYLESHVPHSAALEWGVEAGLGHLCSSSSSSGETPV